jgi:hypothetical protein
MGYFIRPKGSNVDKSDASKTNLKAEEIGVVQAYEDEYIGGEAGFDPTVSGLSGAFHHKDTIKREAHPGDPLPTGGRSAGISSPGARPWNAPSTKRGSMPSKGR